MNNAMNDQTSVGTAKLQKNANAAHAVHAVKSQEELSKTSRGFLDEVGTFFRKLIAAMGRFLDELAMTPERVGQVFASKSSFKPVEKQPLMILQLVLLFPLLFYPWYKSKVVSLSGFQEKMGKDAQDLSDEAKKEGLEDKFNAQLKKLGRSELEAKIEPESSFFRKLFRRPTKYVLKFAYSKASNELFARLSEKQVQGQTLASILDAELIKAGEKFQGTPFFEELETLRQASCLEAPKKGSQAKVGAESKKTSETFFEELKRLGEKPGRSEQESQVVCELLRIGGFFKFKTYAKLKWYERVGLWILNEEPQDFSYRTDLSFKEARQLAKKQRRGFTVRNALAVIYDALMQFSFQFWLLFFCFDLGTGQVDFNKWRSLHQRIVLGLSGALTSVQLWLGFSNVMRGARGDLAPKLSFKDGELAHQVFQGLFLEQQTENYGKLTPVLTENTDRQKKVNGILMSKPIVKSKLSQAFSAYSAAGVSLLDQQRATLRNEASMPKTLWAFLKYWAPRAIPYLFTLVGTAVGATFIPWLLSAIVQAAHVTAQVAGYHLTVAAALGGPIGTAIALGVGCVIGIIAIIRMGRQHKRDATALKERLDKSDPVAEEELSQLGKLNELDKSDSVAEEELSQLGKLNELVFQNAALEKLLIQERLAILFAGSDQDQVWRALKKSLGTRNFDLLKRNQANQETTVDILGKYLSKIKEVFVQENWIPWYLDPINDRGFRQLKPEKASVKTWLKRLGNWGLVGVGKAGSGILFIRMTVFLGVSAAIAASPVGLPLALSIGALWAIFAIYSYHRKSRLEVAKRTLDQVDHRLALARDQQASLLNLLSCKPLPVGAKEKVGVTMELTEASSVPVSGQDLKVVTEPAAVAVVAKEESVVTMEVVSEASNDPILGLEPQAEVKVALRENEELGRPALVFGGVSKGMLSTAAESGDEKPGLREKKKLKRPKLGRQLAPELLGNDSEVSVPKRPDSGFGGSPSPSKLKAFVLEGASKPSVPAVDESEEDHQDRSPCQWLNMGAQKRQRELFKLDEEAEVGEQAAAKGIP